MENFRLEVERAALEMMLLMDFGSAGGGRRDFASVHDIDDFEIKRDQKAKTPDLRQ